jgi:hypothetical protein
MEKHSIIQPFNSEDGLSIRTFYYQQFGRLPHDIDDRGKYEQGVIDAIKIYYQDNPLFSYYTRSRFDADEDAPKERKFNAILTDGLIVAATKRDDDHWQLDLYHNGDQTLVDEFFNFVRPYRIPKDDGNNMYMVVKRYDHLDLEKLPIKKMDIKIDMHYNDDFLAVHSEIENFLTNDNSGLAILHGKQGTGKSSYIRHLITSTDKKVIYFTSDMAQEIASPSFISFIMEQKGSIIVLEDCEELLAARNTGRGGLNIGISNILNMSDGLLGDALQLKFICTFNAPLKDIDKALLRKGRLVARYEFNDLSAEKANVIITEQMLDVPPQLAPISLANLYNYEKPAFEQMKRAIGF